MEQNDITIRIRFRFTLRNIILFVIATTTLQILNTKHFQKNKLFNEWHIVGQNLNTKTIFQIQHICLFQIGWRIFVSIFKEYHLGFNQRISFRFQPLELEYSKPMHLELQRIGELYNTSSSFFFFEVKKEFTF